MPYPKDRVTNISMQENFMKRVSVLKSVLMTFALSVSFSAFAADLTSKVQNPVSDLISLPFQYVMNVGTGDNANVGDLVRIQPVVPFKVTSDLNLITRTIITINDGNLADTSFSAFLSPNKETGFLWGAGAVAIAPTSGSNGMFGVGPTAAGIYINGATTVGGLFSHVFALDDKHSGAITTLQPIYSRTLSGGMYITSAPLIVGDISNFDNVILPVGGGAGKVFWVGKLPVNLNAQAYYNLLRPDHYSDLTFQFTMQFLFPK